MKESDKAKPPDHQLMLRGVKQEQKSIKKGQIEKKPEMEEVQEGKWRESL